MNKKLKLWLPVSLTGLVVIADQVSKALIVKFFPLLENGHFPQPVEVLGNFLRLAHVRNTAIAFGLGQNLPDAFKVVLFVVVPLLLLVLVIVFYFRNELSYGFRWSLAAIFGGGLGNMLDRLLRPAGVVDFIDVNVYGLFGLSRWPTFNIADSAIVVGAVFLAVMMLREEFHAYRNRKKEKTNEQKS